MLKLIQSAGVAAVSTTLILGALLTSCQARAAVANGPVVTPAQEVTLRNVQPVGTSRETWLTATAVNTSGQTLSAPIIVFNLGGGVEVRHVGPATVEPGEAWRIVERIPGKGLHR